MNTIPPLHTEVQPPCNRFHYFAVDPSKQAQALQEEVRALQIRAAIMETRK